MTDNGVFDANQRAQVAKISSYLSGLSTLVGNFVQVGAERQPHHRRILHAETGQSRFAYDPPTPIDIVSDGSSMVVRDRKLATQDVYPLSQTPLRYLLSDRIDLMKDTNVVSVTSDDVFITVTIEEKQALIGTSRLMLMIGAKDSQLKQWTITDPQGYDTTVAVYNLNATKKPDPALFRIDYTNYRHDTERNQTESHECSGGFDGRCDVASPGAIESCLSGRLFHLYRDHWIRVIAAHDLSTSSPSHQHGISIRSGCASISSPNSSNRSGRTCLCLQETNVPMTPFR